MITQSMHVRDTLIRIDVYNSLPAERQQAIAALVDEFNGLGYIDARTEIGPDQYRRMSDKQRAKISSTASKAFAIEAKIKLLLRSDCQIVADNQREAAKKVAERILQLSSRKRTLEQVYPHYINSKRDNITKREYLQIVAELAQLQPA